MTTPTPETRASHLRDGWARLWQAGLTGLGVAALVLLLHWGGLFAPLRLALSNLYYVPSDVSDQLVIVALDNASFERYGRSPVEWSRELYAQLVDALSAARVRVIAFDMLFTEPDPSGDAIFAEAMRRARESETRTRFVLAVAGVNPQGTAAPQRHALGFGDHILPVSPLREQADYIGYANALPDVDGAVRRQASRVVVNAEEGLSFNVATYLAFLRIPALAASQVLTLDDAVLNVTPERQVPVDERGFWRQNYYGEPTRPLQPGAFPVVSLVDVLDGNVDPARFEDRVVLVGLYDSFGATDQYPVPVSTSGQTMAGVEIQAHAIETLLQNEALQPVSPMLASAWTLGLALGASLLFAWPRWQVKLVLWAVAAVLILLAAFLIFNTRLLPLDLFDALLALTLALLIAIGLDINREIQLRRRAVFLLQSLAQVAEQRLYVRNILPTVARDLQTLLPRSRGEIWALDVTKRQFEPTLRWPNQDQKLDLESLVQEATRRRETIITLTASAVPVSWHGRVLLVLAFEVPRRAFDRRARFLIGEMAQRLAPSIDNAYLYQENQRQRATLETVLDNSPAAIVVLDERLDIALGNDRFEALVGDRMTGLFGTSLLRLLEKQVEDAEAIAQMAASFQTGAAFGQELAIDDETYQVEVAPLPDESGRWVVLFNDVTSLIELSNLKTRMIRMASHDLKNPLGRVLGYADLILMTANGDEANPLLTKYLNYIKHAGSEMNQIITEILDLERMRSGKLNRETFDFRRLVAEVYSRHEPDAEGKQQTFTLVSPDETVWVRGDFQQLSQVVTNLIGNAIKYTPDEGRVTVRLLTSSEDASWVRFEVEDNGYGISEEAQAKLFTEFYRVKSRATAHIGGTGLGLSLVKSVVEAHQGQVGVISEENVGSTFYVELPRGEHDLTESAQVE